MGLLPLSVHLATSRSATAANHVHSSIWYLVSPKTVHKRRHADRASIVTPVVSSQGEGQSGGTPSGYPQDRRAGLWEEARTTVSDERWSGSLLYTETVLQLSSLALCSTTLSHRPCVMVLDGKYTEADSNHNQQQAPSDYHSLTVMVLKLCVTSS